jgi:hypothetical protein
VIATDPLFVRMSLLAGSVDPYQSISVILYEFVPGYGDITYWTRSLAAVPIPGGLPLLGAALPLLGLLRLRRALGRAGRPGPG